jgi:hypothetical protein
MHARMHVRVLFCLSFKVTMVASPCLQGARATLSNCGELLKLHLPSAARKRYRVAGLIAFGYGKNDGDDNNGRSRSQVLNGVLIAAWMQYTDYMVVGLSLLYFL